MNVLRRMVLAVLCCILVASLSAAMAEASTLALEELPQVFRPGYSVRLTFSTSLAGDATLTLKSESGSTVAVIREGYPAKAGRNNLVWDAMGKEGPIPEGAYILELSIGGQSTSAPVSVGSVSPVISNALSSGSVLNPGNNWSIQGEINLEATLSLSLTTQTGESYEVYRELLAPGHFVINWDGAVNGEALLPGEYLLTLDMVDATGFAANKEQLHLIIKEPSSEPAAEEKATVEIVDRAPADFSPYTCNHENCYWTLSMGVMDEAAIWAAMMEPMTVVTPTRKDSGDRQVVKLYAEPTEDSRAVGEVTCVSQGLHILETRDDGWSLVEAYSSSIHNSTVKNYAGFFQGYIRTNRLEVKQPYEKYGLLLDKLTQRMYVFEDGKIMTELLVSTGLPNSKQPYNETPAGEFMMVSRTGGFWSGNMYCDLALRVNGGILIHEVPCLIRDEVRYYESFEKVLGEKASHGCIRVQREKNSDGINHKWLWDNIKLNTRVFIWDDVGRHMDIPEASMPLYYNPNGGKNFHSDAYCSSVKDRYLPLTGFTYGQLEEEPYVNLTPCAGCTPPKRQAEIEALNAANGY